MDILGNFFIISKFSWGEVKEPPVPIATTPAENQLGILLRLTPPVGIRLTWGRGPPSTSFTILGVTTFPGDSLIISMPDS